MRNSIVVHVLLTDSVSREIAAYLNQPDVRELIGVDPAVVEFEECNVGIIERFAVKMDRMFPTQHYIAALLERGVRALIYVGANDWVCNWVRVSDASTERACHN